MRCEIRLFNGLDDRLRERHGLDATQFGCLRFIAEHPNCRVVDLAADLAIGVGAISKAVDRYTKLGLVRRDPNPGDRRSSLLNLTPEGTARVREASPTFFAYLDELLGQALTPEQRVQTGAALAQLRASLEQARVGLPTG